MNAGGILFVTYVAYVAAKLPAALVLVAPLSEGPWLEWQYGESTVSTDRTFLVSCSRGERSAWFCVVPHHRPTWLRAGSR